MILSLNKNRSINQRSKYYQVLRKNVGCTEYRSNSQFVKSVRMTRSPLSASFFENFATCVERSRKTRILRYWSHLASRGNFRSSRNHRQHVTSFPCHGRNHPPFTLQAPCYHKFSNQSRMCAYPCVREDILYVCTHTRTHTHIYINRHSSKDSTLRIINSA